MWNNNNYNNNDKKLLCISDLLNSIQEVNKINKVYAVNEKKRSFPSIATKKRRIKFN